MSNILKKIYGKKDVMKLQDKINMLGHDKYSAMEFMTRRLIITILFTIFLMCFTHISYIFIPFIVVAFYLLYYYIYITYPLNKRTKKLDREALYFFEILALTLESGRNLEKSIEITVNNVEGELSDEFRRCLTEVRYGKSLLEALNYMKKRIPSETINNIILNITQTNIFGNSIVETMHSQVDYLREKQTLEIKGEINKIPNKISIVSVLFIIPLILLIVLGPILIQFIS